MNVEPASDLAAVSRPSAAPSESAASLWPAHVRSAQEISASSADGASWPVERWLLGRVLAACGSPPVGVQLWDGTAIAASQGAASGTVQIGNRRTLWRLLLDPRVVFG